MPLAFVLDEHLRGPLWRAIHWHNLRGLELLDVVRVGDEPGIELGVTDPTLLLWSEQENRILVTEDRRTIGVHLRAHLRSGRHSPGVFLVKPGSRIPDVVEFLALAAHASKAREWEDGLFFVP